MFQVGLKQCSHWQSWSLSLFLYSLAPPGEYFNSPVCMEFLIKPPFILSEHGHDVTPRERRHSFRVRNSLKEDSRHLRHRPRPLPRAGSERQTRMGPGRSLCRDSEEGLAPLLTLLLTWLPSPSPLPFSQISQPQPSQGSVVPSPGRHPRGQEAPASGIWQNCGILPASRPHQMQPVWESWRW